MTHRNELHSSPVPRMIAVDGDRSMPPHCPWTAEFQAEVTEASLVVMRLVMLEQAESASALAWAQAESGESPRAAAMRTLAKASRRATHWASERVAARYCSGRSRERLAAMAAIVVTCSWVRPWAAAAKAASRMAFWLAWA